MGRKSKGKGEQPIASVIEGLGRVADGLKAEREWEAEHGALTEAEQRAALRDVERGRALTELIRDEEAEHGPVTEQELQAARERAADVQRDPATHIGSSAEEFWVVSEEDETGPKARTRAEQPMPYSTRSVPQVEPPRAADDGPSHEPPQKFDDELGLACIIDLQQPWFDRAIRMAKERGVSLDKYIEGLVRAAWVSKPLAKRGP